jgi:hypothetical protein
MPVIARGRGRPRGNSGAADKLENGSRCCCAKRCRRPHAECVRRGRDQDVGSTINAQSGLSQSDVSRLQAMKTGGRPGRNVRS